MKFYCESVHSKPLHKNEIFRSYLLQNHELVDYTENSISSKFYHPVSCSFCGAGMQKIIKAYIFGTPPLLQSLTFVLYKLKGSRGSCLAHEMHFHRCITHIQTEYFDFSVI